MNPLRGIIFGLSGYSLVALMNVVGKLLSEILSPAELVFTRNYLAMLFLLGFFTLSKNWSHIKTTRPMAQFFRAALGTMSMVLAMWAITLLPIAVVLAIGFISPLYIVVLSRIFLKEKIGVWKIFATLLGFIGVLIIIDPFSVLSSEVLPLKGVLVALAFSLSNASVILLLRFLGKSDSSQTTTFYFVFLGSIFTVASFFFAPTPNLESLIDPHYMLLILAMGIIGLASLILKTQAYIYAEASTIAPMAYCMILWAGFFDWLIWDTLPSLSLIIGAIIIICANAVITWRTHKHEHKSSRQG